MLTERSAGIMRFIVLGGVGDVGSVVTKDLAASGATGEVCIGDINLDKARKMSTELGAKVAARAIDINDKAGLVSTLKGYDVAVNCVGPFYRHGSKVLEACIEAKVNYVDICDDYDAAELLLGFDGRCREAGITAIICQGASPGITNVMGLLGASKMEAEAIHTAWVESMMDVGGFVVLWHGVHMATGEVPQYLNGQWIKVPALDGAEELEFLSPLGKYTVYYLGHSEPVTMPRFIKGVKTVTNKGNMWPKETDLVSLVKPFSEVGLTTTDPLVVNGVEISRRDFLCHHMAEFFPNVLPNVEGVEGLPHFLARVDVVGSVGGTRARYIYNAACRTNEGTGWSASYAAQAIAEGKIEAKGVFAPEGCVDPGDFFKYLEAKGIIVYETRCLTEPVG
jgi:saccharopine dehydrogenase (NAD+, L-lysine-forming)